MHPLIKPSELEEEMYHYTHISNNIVGMAFVTLFLGSLGTDNPQATAILLIPVAIALLQYMLNYYPQSIKTLEKMKESETYKNEIQEIEAIIKKFKNDHFKYKAIFPSNMLYLFGTVSYFMLLIPNIGHILKTGVWLNTLVSLISPI